MMAGRAAFIPQETGFHSHGLPAEGRNDKIFPVIAELRRLIAAQPFKAFSIYTADGGEVRVPTVDHIAVSPTGALVVVFADDDSTIHVSPLLVARIIVDPLPQGAKVA